MRSLFIFIEIFNRIRQVSDIVSAMNIEKPHKEEDLDGNEKYVENISGFETFMSEELVDDTELKVQSVHGESFVFQSPIVENLELVFTFEKIVLKDIYIVPLHQKSGHGRSTVDAIKKYAEATEREFEVVEILEEAKGFWEKMK